MRKIIEATFPDVSYEEAKKLFTDKLINVLLKARNDLGDGGKKYYDAEYVVEFDFDK